MALQGFERLSVLLHATLNEAVSDDAEAWLRDEVCPVVEELCRNRSFQLMTRWSLDHFCSVEVITPEHRQLEDADQAIVQYAQAIAKGLEIIDQSMLNPSECQISEEDRVALNGIASRPWVQLAYAFDFFHPEDQLLLRDPNRALTSDFRAEERRIPLGDYISRYLLARVKFWKNLVVRLGERINHYVPSSDDEGPKISSRIFRTRIQLDQAVDTLAQACHGENFRRRNACNALVQVYAAYAHNPDLEWLGISRDAWHTAGPQIRMCVRRRSDVSVVERIPEGAFQPIGTERLSLCDPAILRQVAASLQEVATFYEIPEDPDDLIVWAADQARLVLVDRAPRQVFWEGQLIGGGEWDNQPVAWDFLWNLGKSSTQVVDKEDLGGKSSRSRRHRLSDVLLECQELDNRIEAVRGLGYRLDLPPEDVTLLQDDGFGRLQFVDARKNPLI
ncbi:hypothetical protein ACYFX5_00015 [Bremerella sp. T1]|uniref:hypothetical protein n=1 Tax=Bremerella sp. TYQ1 TaxID=3119568 RepID=UPI001CCD12C8|nr:hypothetical protein [Bremerella volcania]UBM36684.1 hypothetical protein LA756_01980 [Bremerella volcania]